MIRKSWLVHGSALVLVVFVLAQMTSCGYVLYPERRGQTGGRIDAGVAVLDAVGLLFFIIPGVVAFAVDFSSGAIYLPPHRTKAVPRSLDPDETVVVHMEPGDLDRTTIETVVSEHIGEPVDLDAENLKVYQVDELGKLAPKEEGEPVPYASRQDS